jgi:hypothetical protein
VFLYYVAWYMMSRDSTHCAELPVRAVQRIVGKGSDVVEGLHERAGVQWTYVLWVYRAVGYGSSA